MCITTIAPFSLLSVVIFTVPSQCRIQITLFTYLAYAVTVQHCRVHLSRSNRKCIFLSQQCITWHSVIFFAANQWLLASANLWLTAISKMYLYYIIITLLQSKVYMYYVGKGFNNLYIILLPDTDIVPHRWQIKRMVA